VTTRRGSDRTDVTDPVLGMVHDVLDGAVTYDGRAVPHREHPEESLVPPFYTSGPSTMDPASTQTSSAYGGAQAVTVQIDTWSAYSGKKEVSELQTLVLEVLHDAHMSDTKMTLSGGLTLVRYDVLRTRIQGEPRDSKMTYHGISDLGFRVQLPTV